MHTLCLFWFCNPLEEEDKAGYFALSYRCIVIIKVLWLFFSVWWVGLLCVIMVFPDHTHYFNAHRTFHNEIK